MDCQHHAYRYALWLGPAPEQPFNTNFVQITHEFYTDEGVIREGKFENEHGEAKLPKLPRHSRRPIRHSREGGICTTQKDAQI
ncbi:MAG: hypothetical protein ACYC6Y_08780 [Thermoguttaceae bacterium]